MNGNRQLVSAIFDGWHAYQEALRTALAHLDRDQLALRIEPNLRSVGAIAAHIVGARARWFHLLMGEGGEVLAAFGRWDRRGAKSRAAEELVRGLEATWAVMQAAIARWSAGEWAETGPGEDASEPAVITRQWVILHLIEHDLHHGGEIAMTLGAYGFRALEL